jgi:hypothetical protein
LSAFCQARGRELLRLKVHAARDAWILSPGDYALSFAYKLAKCELDRRLGHKPLLKLDAHVDATAEATCYGHKRLVPSASACLVLTQSVRLCVTDRWSHLNPTPRRRVRVSGPAAHGRLWRAAALPSTRPASASAHAGVFFERSTPRPRDHGEIPKRRGDEGRELWGVAIQSKIAELHPPGHIRGMARSEYLKQVPFPICNLCGSSPCSVTFSAEQACLTHFQMSKLIRVLALSDSACRILGADAPAGAIPNYKLWSPSQDLTDSVHTQVAFGRWRVHRILSKTCCGRPNLAAYCNWRLPNAAQPPESAEPHLQRLESRKASA